MTGRKRAKATAKKPASPVTMPETAGAGPTANPAANETPEALRKVAQTGVEQVRESYSFLRNVAEEGTDMLEDTYLQAAKGTAELNLKVLEAMRTNAVAGFDFSRALLSVASLSEAMELSARHVRLQFDTWSAQAGELADLTRKVAAETAGPMTAAANRTLKTR